MDSVVCGHTDGGRIGRQWGTEVALCTKGKELLCTQHLPKLYSTIKGLTVEMI